MLSVWKVTPLPWVYSLDKKQVGNLTKTEFQTNYTLLKRLLHEYRNRIPLPGSCNKLLQVWDPHNSNTLLAVQYG